MIQLIPFSGLVSPGASPGADDVCPGALKLLVKIEMEIIIRTLWR